MKTWRYARIGLLCGSCPSTIGAGEVYLALELDGVRAAKVRCVEMPEVPAWMDAESAEAAAEEFTATLLQLSEKDWGFSQSDAKAAGVIHASRWKEITKDKDVCGHVQKGAVVHGGPLRIVDRVCASKSCEKHWPKPSKGSSAKDSGPSEWEKEQAKRAEEQKQWEAIRPAVVKAFVAHVGKIKLTTDLVMAALGRNAVEEACKLFGIKLTPSTIPVVMACASTSVYNRATAERTMTPFGFQLKLVEQAAIKAPEAKRDGARPVAAKTASNKPAKSGKGAAPTKGAKAKPAAKVGKAAKAKKGRR